MPVTRIPVMNETYRFDGPDYVGINESKVVWKSLGVNVGRRDFWKKGSNFLSWTWTAVDMILFVMSDKLHPDAAAKLVTFLASKRLILECWECSIPKKDMLTYIKATKYNIITLPHRVFPKFHFPVQKTNQ